LVRFIGLYGVLLSTILSIWLISAPWITRNVFRLIFKEERILGHLRDICLYLLVTLLAVFLVNVLCHLIPGAGILSFLVKVLISCTVSNGLFLLIYFKHPCFWESVVLIKRMLARSK
jgi:hypothetical protein